MPLDVLNPFDQSVVCSLDYDEGAALEAKIATAHSAAEGWRQVPLQQRIEQVRQGLERFRASSEQIAADVSRQMGKPISQARGEVNTVFARADHMLEIAPQALSPEVLPPVDDLHRRIEHAPLGVVFNLAAWNYPLIIPVNVIVPALAAGNTVLLKHSAKTPLCGQAFEKAFGELDVPGLVSNLVLTHEATAGVIADPRVNHLSFTGSVEGGRAVYRQAAERFIDVGLELGGKDPAYIARDADLDFAIANTVDGACYNAGQSCCAVERVYVHQSLLDDYLAGAREALEAYRPGDPLEEETTIGPLASRGALDFLEEQVLGLYRALTALERSLEELQEMTEGDRTSWDLTNLGLQFLREGNWGAASDTLEKAVAALGPDGLGRSLSTLNRHLNELGELSDTEDIALTLVRQGRSSLEKDDLQTAAESFGKAITALGPVSVTEAASPFLVNRFFLSIGTNWPEGLGHGLMVITIENLGDNNIAPMRMAPPVPYGGCA